MGSIEPAAGSGAEKIIFTFVQALGEKRDGQNLVFCF